jgi:flagellar biosynthetic protein FliP
MSTDNIIQSIFLLVALQLVPALIVTATSFTRIIIVLSILRVSIGLQSTPSKIVIIILAIFLSFHVMSPTYQKIYDRSINPYITKSISDAESIEEFGKPLVEFMKQNTREADLRMFQDMAISRSKRSLSQEDISVIAPAFMISELRRGFEIGFLIALPFLIIDLIVAIIIMSMGMMMLPPAVVSLPIKLIFFVMIDGWNLLARSLMASFN